MRYHPLDQLHKQLTLAAFSLRNAAALCQEVEHKELRKQAEMMQAQIEEMLEPLLQWVEEIEEISAPTRSQYTEDRAWQLVRLLEAGALDVRDAYELRGHVEMAQIHEHAYSRDLWEKLNDPHLYEAINRVLLKPRG